MSVQLLDRTRRILKRLRFGGTLRLDFMEFCEELSTQLGVTSYVLSAKGKVLGFSCGCDNPFGFPEKLADEFSPKVNEFFLKCISTKENIGLDIFTDEVEDAHKYLGIILPVGLAGRRFGTIFVYRYDKPFDVDDIILAEYCATIIGMELKNEILIEEEEQYTKELSAENAVDGLSAKEKEAALAVLKEINNGTGVVNALQLSDKYGITRSIFVNTLRKFVSAGVMETVSKGPKGTYVRVLNDAVFSKLSE